MRRSLVSKRSAMLLLAALPLVGCPDPDAAYDDYVARRPAPPSAPDVGDRDAIAGGMLPDVTGTHLLAIATFIDNDRPLLFHADVVLTPSASPTPDDAGTLSVTATALRCQYEMVCDKTLTGAPLPTITGTVKQNGEFVLDFGQQTVVGEANPISGRPITAVLKLIGNLQSADVACGALGGQVFDPIMAPLDGTGSTFALTRQGDRGATIDFASVPVVKDCPAPVMPDAATPPADAQVPGDLGRTDSGSSADASLSADAGPAGDAAPSVDAAPPVADAAPPAADAAR